MSVVRVGGIQERRCLVSRLTTWWAVARVRCSMVREVRLVVAVSSCWVAARWDGWQAWQVAGQVSGEVTGHGQVRSYVMTSGAVGHLYPEAGDA